MLQFQIRQKKTEGWADFADDLTTLANKAYADLHEEARERLALNAYLKQIDDVQVSFSVKQGAKNPGRGHAGDGVVQRH